MTQVTRFEYIDHSESGMGRRIVEYGLFTVSIQDEGRTVKVFKDFNQESLSGFVVAEV